MSFECQWGAIEVTYPLKRSLTVVSLDLPGLQGRVAPPSPLECHSHSRVAAARVYLPGLGRDLLGRATLRV